MIKPGKTTPPPGEFGASGWWEEAGTHALLRVINPVRMAYLRERCGDLAGRQVVDVGCGGGILSVTLAAAGADITGIDIAAGAVATAQREARRRALPARFVTTDANSFAATGAAARFDLVTCMEMLEHVADPAAEIEALAALLCPGGDLVLSTINRTPLAYAAMVLGLEQALRTLPPGTHRYDYFLRPEEVAGHCRAAGLEVLDIVGANWSFFGKTFLLSRTSMPVNYLLHARQR